MNDVFISFYCSLTLIFWCCFLSNRIETPPSLRLLRRVTKRWLKVYCLLGWMLIIKTRFVIFMIVVMNDVLKIFLSYMK